MPDLVERAQRFATDAHRAVGQLRKYTGQPYEEHLRRVAQIVAGVTDDAEMIAAAWLHDVVEDTPITIEEVERAFGRGVRELVDALTDVSLPRHGNRAARKALDREHLASAPPRAQTIKLADLIDNCGDICRHSPRFGRVFLAEMEDLLDVLVDGDAGLQRRARKTMQRWARHLDSATHPDAPARGQPRDALPPEVGRAVRLFARTFRADDVARPLPLPDAVPADRERTIRPSQVLDGGARLADVVMALTRHDVCFVARDGAVWGYVSRAEMQGPVARMWLFGMITSVELAITEGIRRAEPPVDWMPLITPARLRKARELQSLRAEQGRPAALLDCLQFSDKLQIVLALDERERPLLRGRSKAESQRLVRDLENLRNGLAHAQDIVSQDWAQIARLARRIDELDREQESARTPRS